MEGIFLTNSIFQRGVYIWFAHHIAVIEDIEYSTDNGYILHTQAMSKVTQVFKGPKLLVSDLKTVYPVYFQIGDRVLFKTSKIKGSIVSYYYDKPSDTWGIRVTPDTTMISVKYSFEDAPIHLEHIAE